MNEQLSIMNVVDMLLRKWYVIFIAAIIGGLAAYLFTDLFIEPKYSTETTLYVNASNKKTDEISNANLSASQQLVNTYAEILKARNFLDKIAKDLDGKYTASEIKGMLTMASVNDTEVLSITVKGTNKDDVYQVAQLIAKYSTDELKNVVGAGSVTVLESPLEPKNPISPNVRANTLIGVLLGILFASLIIVVLELLDTRIKSGEEFANNYEEPLLGEIPTLEESQNVQVKESRG